MKTVTISLLILLLTGTAMAQGVAINEDSSSPDPSAMLDVQSTDKGILVPRMTQAQRNSISNPANGLMIYQTDNEPGFYYNSGTPATPLWQLVGSNAGVFSQWDSNGPDIFYDDGNVGIGTNAPQALFHVRDLSTGGGNILFEGSFTSIPDLPPAQGSGTRLMWYPDKASFRAGRVTGTHWDAAEIGNYSFATGYNSRASGAYSTSWGFAAEAAGGTSTAWGSGTEASGSQSSAWGSGSVASGLRSTAFGWQAEASGQNATAFGANTTAPSYVETVIGRYNTAYTPNSETGWSSGDRLFVIGNGSSASNPSDALVVLKNGRVGIGTSNPSDNLTVQTRIRSENSSGDLRTIINTTGGGAAGFIQTYGPSGNSNVRISTHSSSTDHGSISVRDANGNNKAWMYVDGNSIGWVRADRVRIVGGSDLAENFEIISPQLDPMPGMVVSIDPGNAGKLRLSDKPYDNKVAGIISGANGVESGMVMGQTGTIADGEYPVSLTGRVFVYTCDEGGEIMPGDMLTTSSRPGYAKRASDKQQAFGAIIGKAMTDVNENGFVLVLVNLQ